MRRFPKLASGRSPNWAFMERFEVPDYDDPAKTYLTRWRIVQTPLFAVMLHRLDGPDPRPTLHDHPWSFVSLVLRGGYTERLRRWGQTEEWVYGGDYGPDQRRHVRPPPPRRRQMRPL